MERMILREFLRLREWRGRRFLFGGMRKMKDKGSARLTNEDFLIKQSIRWVLIKITSLS